MTVAAKLYLNNNTEKSYINSTENQINFTNISILNLYNETVNHFIYREK